MVIDKQKIKIQVLDFHKSYGNKRVHNGVSFHVNKGECLGLIGGSGAGKSVILRSLIGLERPDKGQIIIDGLDIAPVPEKDLVDLRKRVAYVFQGGALFDSMTVYENLAYPLREHTKLTEDQISARIKKQLADFGLAGNEEIYPASLSGGMQKRVGLARAIIMGPEVVLYDEPTAGLDPFNTKRIQEMILTLKEQGMTSVLVTHDMPSAFATCDRIIFLQDGRIEEEGTLDEIQDRSENAIQKFINGEKP